MDDVMVPTQQPRGREASQEVAIERVIGFAQEFGEAHLTLACHAAFPLVLTPDLLYRLWANFVPQAPWTAVADILLSPLCREVGYELYEVDVTVRNLLLKELKEDERLGQQRLNDLADFLTDYVAQQLYSDDPDARDLAQAQRWTALAYTWPDEAAHEIAEALSELVSEYDREYKQEGRAELIRIASLLETSAEPLAEFTPLLIYARSMADFARGDLEGATAQLDKMLGQEHQVQIARLSLPIPKHLAGDLTKATEVFQREAVEVAPAGQEVWRFVTGERLYAAPTIHQGTLYLGTQDGALHAVDTRQGSQLWRFRLPEHWLPTEAAAAEGLVFIGTRDARPLGSGDKALLALDATTGEEAWRFETGALNLSAPVVGVGWVYFAANDGTVYALEAKGGQELWRRKIEGWTPFHPTVAESTLYLGSQGPILHALDAESGRVRWRFTTGGQVLYSPAVAEGMVYFGSWDGYLYAVEAQRGNEIWRFTAGKALITSPTVAEGIIYFGCSDRQAYAVEAESGQELWRFKTGGRVYSAPVVVEDKVYFGSDDKNLYAVDAANGAETWRFEAKGKIKFAPIVAREMIYLGSRDGTLYAISCYEEERLLSPQEYESQGDILQAARAYALAGDLVRAAELFQREEEYTKAAELYRLFAAIYKAESVAQIKALEITVIPNLLDNTYTVSTNLGDIKALSSFLSPGLPTTLTALADTAGALMKHEQVDALGDKLAYLADALLEIEKVAQSTQSLIEPERTVLAEITAKWREVITREIANVSGRAALKAELRTKQAPFDERLGVVLQLENRGQAVAENVTVSLEPSEDYEVVGESTTELARVFTKRSSDMEFTIHPKREDRVRLDFTITWDDREGQGKSHHFADTVSFIEVEREFARIPNPYVAGNPITSPKLFFGRQNVFDFVLENLVGAEQKNILVLHGQRRTGKSSVLLQLRDRVLPQEFIPVYINMVALPDVKTVDAFLARLTYEIGRAARKRDLELEVPTDFGQQPATTFDRFMDAAEEALSGQRFVVMFDEFELIESKIAEGMDAGVLTYFRNLMQFRDSLVFVFTGSHRLHEMPHDHLSILFSIALYREISFLEEKDTRRLITEPVQDHLRYDAFAIEKVIRVTHCHPYLVQLICWKLVNYLNSQQRNYATINDVNEVLDQTLVAAEAYFNSIWVLSTSHQRLALALLTALLLPGKETAALSEVEKGSEDKGVAITRHELIAALNELCRRGVLDERTNGELRYRFQIDLLRMWVGKNKPLSRVLIEEGL